MGLVFTAATGLFASAHATIYDVSQDFSPTNNPAGAWTYGWKEALDGSFTALAVQHVSGVDNGTVPSWQLTSGEGPAVYKNVQTNTVTAGGGLVAFPAGTVWFIPGENGRSENFGVARFTAPSGGAYQIETAVAPVYDGAPQGDTDYHVLKNGAELFARFLSSSNSASFSATVQLATGDTIEFVIGRGADGSSLGSGLRLRATLTAHAPPVSSGVFDLADGFSASANPNLPWAYGWAGSLGGAFTALTVPHISAADGGARIPSWQLTSSQTPAVYKNVNSNTVSAGAGLVSFPPRTVWYYPGENGRPENFGVIRFTAPSNGSYRIETSVAPVYTGSPQGDTDFHVLKNGSELFGQFLAPSDTASFSNTVVMAAGDIIDFAIGRGADGSSVGSGLRIHAGLTLLPPPPAGVLEIPVVNHSFENPVLEDGQETVNNIPGWTGMGTFFHVRNPTDDWFPGTSQNNSGSSLIDGFNIAGINNDTRLYQDVAAVFLPEHTYTLTVLMGTRNSVPFGIPKVRLISAGTTVAELLPGAPANGTFERVALTYVSPSSGEVIGTPIRIEFQGLGGDAQFWIDDVRLSASPPNIVTNPPQPGVFDLSDGFSPDTNPNSPWAYGWAGSLGGAFTALTVPHVSTADGGVQVPSWQLTSYQTPAVYKNTSGQTISVGGGLASYPAGTVWYYPGENGRAENFGVIRFIAPSNGAYRIETAVAPVYNGPPQGDTDFHVLKNGVELFGRFLTPNDPTSFSNTVVMATGDAIDFAIGRGADGSSVGSGLRIQTTITSAGTSPLPANHPPVARAVVGPVFELWGDETNLLVVAGNGQNAVLELDGSLSSDPDGDALDYLWIEEGQPAPFAAGVLAINSFELGTHTIVLVADDGRATGSDAVSIDVITLGEAVEELILFVTETDLGRKDKRPLLATLNRVRESFEEGHLNAGVKQLGAFQMKIRAHLLKVRPAAGRRLIAAVDQLVDAAMSAMDDTDDPKRGRGGK